MKQFPFCLAIIFAVVFSNPAWAAEKRLSLTGSSTLAPLVSEIAQRFEQQHSEIRIDVQTGGSSRGVADARRGLADLGMSSRSLYKEEQTGINTHRIAIDGVAFVAHASNPIENLSKEQALQIYTGKIDNWKLLGGQDAPITVIDRAKGRSEVSLLTKFFGIKAREMQADVVAGENQQCIKLLTGNKNAIVYLSLGTAKFEAKRGTPIKLLSLDGVQASSNTIRDGSYPIVRPLLLVSAEQPNQQTQAFLDYALSSKVHDLVQGQAFVPVQ